MKAGKFKTDKSQQMLDNYDKWFKRLKNKPVAILELGILKGGSLLLWNDYFKKGTIAGLDMEPIKIRSSSSRIKIYQGEQDDPLLLKRIVRENAPHGFDIIIDDASHYGLPTKRSFWYLFDSHLKKGGVYIIEDWGTGYWPDWPDGKAYRAKKSWSRKRFPSHDNGMVGVIKQLIDELGMEDITARGFGVGRPKDSKISCMEVHRGQVAIFKK